MEVGLIQVDGGLPNLALLKIASYHLKKGDNVEWFIPIKRRPEITYMSQIFNFSNYSYAPPDTIKGGTGISFKKLPPEIDRHLITEDAWRLYPNFTPNLGFLSRGCRLMCKFCVVPEKEGGIQKESSVSELLVKKNSNQLVLLDNDALGCPTWEDDCREMTDRDLKVSICQGINIRTLSEKQAISLVNLKPMSQKFNEPKITCAWDQIRDEKNLKRGIQRLISAGWRPRHIQAFVLTGFDTTFDEDYYRVKELDNLGVVPFVMRMMEDKYYPSEVHKKRAMKFQRWVNRRELFKSCSFEQFYKKQQ